MSAITTLHFWIDALSIVAVYAALTMVLNIEAGWGGMWDLGIAGLFAVGAYTYTIFTIKGFDDVVFAPGWPGWAGILMAMLVSGIVAFLVGLPALRARREYFLIITFAFAEVIRAQATNMEDVTRGTVGFNNITKPLAFGFEGDAYRAWLLFLTCLAVLIIFLFTRKISNSSYGRALRAMRDNEAAAVSLGIRVSRLRLQTFVLAGVLIGGIATLYVALVPIVQPGVFRPTLTFAVWTMLVLGGIGSKVGPILGAAALIIFTEFVELIKLEVPTTILRVLVAVHPLSIGLLLVLLLRFRPQGLLSERNAFGKRSRKQAIRAEKAPRDGKPPLEESQRQ